MRAEELPREHRLGVAAVELHAVALEDVHALPDDPADALGVVAQRLRVLDRLKDMINRAGYKVFGAEVENVLCDHPEIVEAAVVGQPDPVLGEKVTPSSPPATTD